LPRQQFPQMQRDMMILGITGPAGGAEDAEARGRGVVGHEISAKFK